MSLIPFSADFEIKTFAIARTKRITCHLAMEITDSVTGQCVLQHYSSKLWTLTPRMLPNIYKNLDSIFR